MFKQFWSCLRRDRIFLSDTTTSDPRHANGICFLPAVASTSYLKINSPWLVTLFRNTYFFSEVQLTNEDGLQFFNFFSWGLHPSGVAIVNHLPLSSSLIQTNSVSSVTTSINLPLLASDLAVATSVSLLSLGNIILHQRGLGSHSQSFLLCFKFKVNSTIKC